MTKRKVTGLGGIFFKCDNPEEVKQWYQEKLGIESNQYGGVFKWRDDEEKERRCLTSWSPMKKETEYFAPSKNDFMINYRVEDLPGMMEDLRKSGVQIVGEIEEFEYGKFAWIVDPEGRKIELWEPIDQPLLDFNEEQKG